MNAANSAWRRLAGKRSPTIATFGLFDISTKLTFAIVAPKPGQPLSDLVHAQVTGWALDGSPIVRATALEPTNIEVPGGVYDLAANADRLVLAAATGGPRPGQLDVTREAGWSAVSSGFTTLPVAMSPAQVEHVRSQPFEEWPLLGSSPPCEEWLFAPRIQQTHGLVTFGSSNGQTALFRLHSDRVEPLGIAGLAVTPVVVEATDKAGAKHLKMYHRAPERGPWSAYSEAQSSGAIALPLRVAELTDGGSQIRAPVSVSVRELEFLPVLAFDVTSVADGDLLFAVAHGSSRNAEVTLLQVSPDEHVTRLPSLRLPAGAAPRSLRVRQAARGVALAVQIMINNDRLVDLFFLDKT